MLRARNPIAAAVTLAATTLTGPAWAQGSREASSRTTDWSRVRSLRAGVTIQLTLADTNRARRIVVATTRDDLTVLNLEDYRLPDAVSRALQAIASEQPDHLARAASGRGTWIMNGIQLGGDGVFADGQRLAEISQLVRTHGRGQVVEIRRSRRGRGLWGHLGPLGGYFVGGLLGGYATSAVCRCDTGGFLVGMVTGGLGGGAYGWHAARRRSDEIVYSRPLSPEQLPVRVEPESH